MADRARDPGAAAHSFTLDARHPTSVAKRRNATGASGATKAKRTPWEGVQLATHCSRNFLQFAKKIASISVFTCSSV
jgi:hypothetical protein